MPKLFYIKGLGFIEDNEANAGLLMKLGKITVDPVKETIVVNKTTKKNDSVKKKQRKSDSGNALGAEE